MTSDCRVDFDKAARRETRGAAGFLPRFLLTIAVTLVALSTPAWSKTYTVNNATDFNNLPRLNAGDVVQLNSGTYGAINKTLESSIADDATAKSSPIVIYAVTPGGVVIDAPSQIILSGRGITLAGLDFSANSGISSSYIIGTALGSRYMILSNIRFNGCAAGATSGNWIHVQGFYHSIRFCTFINRPATVSAPIISFMPDTTEGGVTVPRLHSISYCYFGPRATGTGNGYETIRLGTGDLQTFDMQVTIEHNLFYRSIWRTDGQQSDPEIISIKSRNNKILYNTILESQGGISLRAGDGATVEGNFIFGAGTINNTTNISVGSASANQAGIRVIGTNHIVRNNYIENIVGTDARAALCLMSGESDYYQGNPATGAANTGSYAPAHNAKIYNNTFVNCAEVNLGFLSPDSYTNSSGTYVAKSPTNVLFYNNAWQGNGTASAAIKQDTTVLSGYIPIALGGSGGNYFYETSSGKLGWTSGMSNSTFSGAITAGVTSNYDNYKIPVTNSPLLNKATNTLVATNDIRGLTRPTTNQDIGCYEREVTATNYYKPLLRTNVGPGFDGGPTNSYPTAGTGDSVPTILTASLPGGALTLAYSQTLLASGGDAPLTWSIISGSLPTGLSLLPSIGLISGTPTQSGTFTITFRVTDSDLVGPDSADKTLTLSISASSSVKLSISTSKAYSSTGGTKPADSYDGKTSTRWSSSVKSTNPNTNGTVFGTDVTGIIYDLGENKNLSYVRLNWYSGANRTDSYRLESATNTNVWTTNAWTTTNWTTILAKTTSQLTNGYETVNLTNASGRYVRLVSWGNSSGNGFTGLNEVEVYGSTYVAPDARQTQTIIFGALDPALQTDPPIALAAYSLSSSNALTGLPISYESSDASVATVDGSTVTIVGSGSTWITATQSGDTNYQAAAPVQQLLTVTAVSPGITSSDTATATKGLPFRYQITAVREPTSYGATGLPDGLVVDSVTGKISGAPTTSGLFAVTLTAQNSSGAGSATLNLNVVEPYVYETFESYTNGFAVPLVSPSSTVSGIKASGQITNAAGTSVIGGTSGKVAWYNDNNTGASGQLEFNAGAAGQSYLVASFELLNNATPSASGTMPLEVSLAAWNTGNTTAGGSSGKRIANLTFNQFGSLTAPNWYVKNGATLATSTYVITNKQTVHLFANDHDSNPINYVGPDGNVRTLSTNSFAVFLNSSFIGMYGLNLAATANDGTTVLTGNNNLGRLCFNTTSGNTGNWLIDNVVVSDMPTDVAIPAPALPLISSSNSVNGQAGVAFSYQTTTSELASSFIIDGILPVNLSFNTTNGLISGTPNQTGVFPVTIYAVNDAGTASLDVALNIADAPPNIFTGSDSSLNTGASWSLGTAPNSSTSGGSYTDLVFSSTATNLATISGNINGKSMNVTNGSSYTLSSLRTNAGSATTFKIGNTGTTDTTPFTNTLTGVTNELVFLTNSSTLTLSTSSPSNNVPPILELHNSGTIRIETGSTMNIPCNISQSAAGIGISKTGAGKLSLSGSNSYTGATTIESGVLALAGSNSSAVTVKTNAILEIALANPGTASAILSSALSLESGSKVRIAGSPLSGSNYTLVSAAALTNNATLETPISGFQLTKSGNSLVLIPAGLSTPVITWSNPAAITYGTPLSATQLNATSSVAGTYVYNPTNGSVLPAGTNTLQVVFSATDTNSYVSPVTNSVSLVVNKATPAITAAPTASAITYGQTLANSVLSGGSANVGGSFAFTTPSTAPSAGTASQAVTFTPTDTANYNTTTTNISVTVNKAAPVITWNNPASITYGAPLSTTQLNATSSVAGSFVYDPTNGAILPVGTNTLTAVFTATDSANYVSPLTNTVSLVVSAAAVSSNAGLANLVLSSGSLNPIFDSNTTNYTATVSNLLSIRVTPTLSQSNASVKVNGTTVASGAASGKIRLLPGTNTITNVVTAQDGTTTKTYTIAVVQNDEFDTLRARWQSTLISNGLAASSTNSIGSKAYGFWRTNAASLNTNATSSDIGLWSDLPINTNSITDATASGNMVTSFSRLYKMAQAYATPGCSANGVTLTGNAELATAIVNALDWMVANVYKTSGAFYGNWYDWEVQGAQYFADAQTLMYAQLTEDQLLNYAAAIDNYGPNSVNMQDYFFWGALTGANTTSVALVAAVSGIVEKDAAKIAEINAPQGVPKVFAKVTDGDGFYEDGSYIFHNNVPYNGHYGLVMLEGVTTLATLLDGSTWTIYDPVKFPNVYDWITDGFQPFFYRGSFMDCVRGRSVGTSGETGPSVGAEALTYIQKVAGFSTTPTNLATAFNSFVASPHPATGQYHFPNMDRVVAHRTNFSLAVSMSSTRVNNYEDLFGDANTKGYFQGDGMTYLYVGNTETQFTNGYWPSVDIYHLTGTTTEQGTTSTPSPTDQHFVGGADVMNSNGVSTYGVAAFSLHPVLNSGTSTLFGKKSYFMLENEVVCLGAGITAGGNNEIHTTVENRAQGTSTNTAALWVNGAATTRTLGSSATLSSATNCAIDGVAGYHFFGNPGNLQAAFEQNSGTWGAIHPGDSDTTTYTNNYLKLYYKHGVKPTNASYAYAILPKTSPSAVSAYSRNPQTVILSNTPSVQAVKNATLGVVAANFWTNSGGTADLITADKACSVITYESADRISIGISDPSQTLSGSNGVITVTLNRAAIGTLSTDPDVTVLQTSPTIQLQADVSGLKGSTLHASFSLSAAPIITGNMNLAVQVAKAVSYQITSDTAGASYGATGLPSGLSVDNSGLIYGTPTEAGTYSVTLSATNNAGRTGYATLTLQVVSSLAELSNTYSSSTTWTCPANVASVQVECWGAGGAGGSAVRGGTNKAATGGGGAGGAYSKLNSFAAQAGTTYFVNIGNGGVSSTNHLATVAGGDSSFGIGSTTNCLAKGGAGGQSIVNSNADAFGSGGSGTASGSIGDQIYAGGSGATSTINTFGGGGGGSGGTNSAGTSPASTTNGLGAVAVAGGGNGGNANPGGGSGDGQSPTSGPGGGGGGARAASTAQRLGGTGANGQVVLTIKSLSKVTPTVAVSGTNSFTYNGAGQGPDGIEKSADSGSAVVSLTYEGANGTTYGPSTNKPVNVGSYTARASVAADDNYNAVTSAAFSFAITKAQASVTLGDLLQAYSGAQKTVSATTVPSGLPVALTYNGSGASPSSPGVYPVVGNISDPNYEGTGSGTLIIHGPLPAADALTKTNSTSTYKFSLATLLSNDARVTTDGTVLTNSGLSIVDVMSGSGNTASIQSTFVVFNPSTNSTDFFTYRVTDGTSTNSATVTVTLGSNTNTVYSTLQVIGVGLAIYDGTNTAMTNSFIGVPNQTYGIEYKGELTEPFWSTVGAVNSGSGSFSVGFSKPGNYAADWNGSMFFRGYLTNTNQ